MTPEDPNWEPDTVPYAYSVPDAHSDVPDGYGYNNTLNE